MKILVLGKDGRAHATVWKLFNSPQVNEVICAPGNAATSILAPSVDLDPLDAATVGRWAFDESIDMIVPVDHRSLQRGLVDEVVSFHVGVCGPSQQAARISASRCTAKTFMLRHNIPTAAGRAFTDLATAEKFLATQALPVIIKADHPADGEGVYTDRYAAIEGARRLFQERSLESDGNGIVIESFLTGPRVVFSAFTDGTDAVPMLPVRLYDRLEEGNQGVFAPNMGAHTSTSVFAQRLGTYMHEKLITPIVQAMARDNIIYWGILGIDCVITKEGPRITAIRCGMHECETQVVLPRLEDDMLPWLQATIARRLKDMPPPRWRDVATVGLGLVANGYPHHFPMGGPISGIEDLDEGVLCFHSATERSGGLRYQTAAQLSSMSFALPIFGSNPLGDLGDVPRTNGGHVMTVVAQGETVDQARELAVRNAERIRFDGRSFRRDIGATDFR